MKFKVAALIAAADYYGGILNDFELRYLLIGDGENLFVFLGF